MEVDRLSKFASIAILEPELEDREKKVFIEYLPDRTTEKRKKEVLDEYVGPVEPSWMDPIVTYLKDGVVPTERKEAKRLMY